MTVGEFKQFAEKYLDDSYEIAIETYHDYRENITCDINVEDNVVVLKDLHKGLFDEEEREFF